MNKEVILYSNNYYKNKAVYEYSLRGKFNNVSFADLSYFPAPPVLKQKHEALQEQVKQLESELQEKTREITVLNEAAETIRKMLSSRSWRITAPLRALAELFRSEKQTDDPRN
jgi:predicted  nucleic acid-binding Zn-ribbon protein